MFRAALLSGVLIGGVLAGGCGGKPDAPDAPIPTSPSGPDASEPNQGSVRPPQPPRPDPPPVAGTCDESRARWAIGRPATSDLLERARLDAGAQVARFIRPNQPITMEYASGRVNLYLTAQGVVQFVVCG